EDALKEFPHHLEEAKKFRNDSLIQAIESADRARMLEWYSKLANTDAGIGQRWKEPQTDVSKWDMMNLPGYWADQKPGNVNGAVWFTRMFTVPKALTNKPVRLELGRIVDQDSVFLNGKFIGTTGYQYPPRRYDVPPGILALGENRITIRVISQSGRGGFVPDKPYFIAAGSDTVDLKGEWKYKVGTTMNPLPGQTFIRWKPLGLYNAMIAPLVRFKIAGVIWYQGESNTGAAEEYENLFPALIKDWRSQWGVNFPFLYVQLANFMEPQEQPLESNWARLRESQRKALHVPNTGMAVAIDAGEWNDIHPLNKKIIGERLARHARKIVYGEERLTAASPEPAQVSFEANRVVIQLTNAQGGLQVKGSTLKQFAISADGKQFVWAAARIENTAVIVSNEEVSNPVAVRYAWADNPQSANLYNKEGLPVSPFTVFKGK
ncbi:MAG TPA: sialate O-acetylesterase, partial [Chryseosolibacter sp.]